MRKDWSVLKQESASAVGERFARMRQVLNLQQPDRMPCGDWRMVEYRADVYHLGEMEFVPEPGEVGVSSDGTRRFTKDGGVWAVNAGGRYRDHEDVLNVDLDRFEVEQVGETMLGEMARLAEEGARTHFPVPMHYGTLVTRATIEFGWEPFLTAAALEPERLGRVLDRFGEASLAVATGWAQTEGVELICIHDDIAATRAPLMHPDWFRTYVFPWYQRIFDVIHRHGRKVLYMCDGNYQPIVDDIVATGPDGLYIECSSMDPEAFMRAGGSDKLYLIKTDSGGSENWRH